MKRINAALGTIGPVGPYSQAVVSGNLVFTAGRFPPLTGSTHSLRSSKNRYVKHCAIWKRS